MGAATQLVDAIDAAAATLRGPSALSTATLSCLAAAADALDELPEQVRLALQDNATVRAWPRSICMLRT